MVTCLCCRSSRVLAGLTTTMTNESLGLQVSLFPTVSSICFVLASDLFLVFTGRGGQLETLQWLKTLKGFELDRYDLYTSILSNACKGGHMDIIRWLKSEGCPMNYEACSGAAKGGQVEVLRWLKSEGCTWDSSTFSSAADGGHLEVLR